MHSKIQSIVIYIKLPFQWTRSCWNRFSIRRVPPHRTLPWWFFSSHVLWMCDFCYIGQLVNFKLQVTHFVMFVKFQTAVRSAQQELSTHLATPPVSIWTHNSFPSVENGHFEICNPHHLMRSKIHTIFSLGYPLFAVRIVGYPLIVVRTKIPTPTMYPATPPISIWASNSFGTLRTIILRFMIHSGADRRPGMTLVFKKTFS